MIVENDAVSILGDTGKSKVGLIGSGRWSGSGIARRYAVDAPIRDSTWGKLEHALRRAFAGGAPRATAAAVAEAAVAKAAAAPMPAGADSDADSSAASSAASGAAPERGQTGSRARERRSGWWAFAAFGVALVGTLVSWQMMPSGDSVALGITIALGVGAFALAIYGGYGLGTRCPSCRSWYRRETTATTETGTSTYSKQIDEPIRDSSGKQIGTTSVTATYERTEYRYDYRCKECAHRWTGHGSSERRIH